MNYEEKLVIEVNAVIPAINKKWSRSIAVLPERVYEFRSLVASIHETAMSSMRSTATEWQINKLQRLVNNACN